MTTADYEAGYQAFISNAPFTPVWWKVQTEEFKQGYRAARIVKGAHHDHI